MCSCEDNIKRNLKEILWGFLNWIHVVQFRDKWRVDTHEHSMVYSS
jgi:hypothetical protein